MPAWTYLMDELVNDTQCDSLQTALDWLVAHDRWSKERLGQIWASSRMPARSNDHRMHVPEYMRDYQASLVVQELEGQGCA